MIKIALVGRANVGKSTLFNCFSKEKSAIVYDQPGVTRDPKKELIQWGDYSFYLTDTPGIDLYEDELLKRQVLKRIEEEAEDADYLWLMVDGTVGLTSIDRDVVKLIRKFGKPVIVLVNKVDRKDFDELTFYELGFEHVVAVSAEHQIGLHDIFAPMDAQRLMEGSIAERRSQIAVLGRPNAGKSTFINAILGEDRQLTGDMPGLTRESVKYPFDFHGEAYELIDTAGIKKKAKTKEDLEKLSLRASFDTLQFAECIIYMIDGKQVSQFGLDQQDLAMIYKILEEGRCLVVCMSKWDEVKDPKMVLDTVKHTLMIKGFSYVPIVPISSFERFGVSKIFDVVKRMLQFWNKRISTGKLNSWLKESALEVAPPSHGGRAVKLKFATQVKTRPPRICVFVNVVHDGLKKYERYLMNRFHKEFGYEGVPVRVFFRATKNPYVAEQTSS
ncbi:MAG: ribosome biogenesis GTPase Der [Alphaproteobacteria bacterium]|nr:MAG: ribosome biogenesis GTPase Der [Alphaproteobacteria bacterium]